LPAPRRLPMSRPRVIHRRGLKTALDKSFNALDNSGLYPELSTCAHPGLYHRLRLPSSSAWCWFWPALVRGPRSVGQLPGRPPIQYSHDSARWCGFDPRALENPASENQAGGPAHSPRRRCAEPSHAGALADPDRLRAIMATMRPLGNGAAATVSNYRPQIPANAWGDSALPPLSGAGDTGRFLVNHRDGD
jgi:hypothetical protein